MASNSDAFQLVSSAKPIDNIVAVNGKRSTNNITYIGVSPFSETDIHLTGSRPGSFGLYEFPCLGKDASRAT